jgi:hypothetical protein
MATTASRSLRSAAATTGRSASAWRVPRAWRPAIVLLLTAAALFLVFGPSGSSTDQGPGITQAPGYGELPLAFEPSRGRTDADFIARSSSGTALISGSGAELSLGHGVRASSVDLRVIGGGQSEPAPMNRLPGVVNDLRGDDATRWQTHIPTFERVRYAAVYPGVDLDWHGTQQRLEYDFRVAPGGDPGQIAMRVAGADRVRLARNGDLVVAARGEKIRQSAPVAYQGDGSSRTPVDARFELSGNTVSFSLGAYDRSRPLVIDPVVLDYSTYLGGSDADRANGIAVDSAGAAYLTGRTLSTDFNTAGPIEPAAGQGDVFVTKLNAAGDAVVYSTYLGGEGDDSGNGIAVHGGGAYIVGTTESTDFNTVNPASPNKDEGIADAFVAKLNDAGDGLVYSTYLGGGGGFGDGFSNSGNPDGGPFEKKAGASDEGVAIAIDASGAAYVTGNTHAKSSDQYSTGGFPLKGQIEGDTSETEGYGCASDPACTDFQRASSMTSDAFVTKLTPAGNELAYSTYIGGDYGDGATAIAVDSTGSAYVAGATNSPDFNRVGGIEGQSGGGFDSRPGSADFDAFVSKLTPAGDALVYSTYVGGTDFDAAHAIAVDSAGAAYVTGKTDSADFGAPGEQENTIEGDSPGPDAFVSKLNPAGGALEYSTYLGGGLADAGNSIAVDSAGRALITGTTSSRDFDRAGELEGDAGLEDAFVSSLTPAGDLACSTYLGGEGADYGNAIAVGPAGAAYVAGSTESSDFNSAGPVEGDSAGPDAFASKLSLTEPCEPRPSEGAATARDDLQVYVVVLDGLRPREVDMARAPFLNELKESGTWYEQARAVYLAETLPNHAAMMTGVLPQRSGLLGNDYWERNPQTADPDPDDGAYTPSGYNHRMLDPTKLDVETLPTTLEESCDVSSAVVQSKGYLWHLFGGEPPNPDDVAWQRRADYTWGAPESGRYIKDPDDHTPDASVMADGFMPWLTSDAPSPRFAFLNLGDVDRAGHVDESGATAPDGTLTAFRQGALTDTDTQVRIFVQQLKDSGAWDNSVVIFTSDHGMDWSTPDHHTGSDIYPDPPAPNTTTVGNMPGVARIVGGGGTTMFYLHPGANPEPIADTLKAVEGIETVATRAPVPGYPGLDDLGMDHPDTGDIIGLNKPGWRDGGYHGSAGNPIPGNHGHAVTQHSTLFVAGGHPALDETPESVSTPVVFSRPDEGPGNLSVAPTVARLFGLQGPEGGYDGAPLSEAFDEWALKPHSPCQASDLPVLDSTDVSVTEGDTGTTPAEVTVRLTKPGEQPVSVDYETVDGTATAPGDYESQGPGTLTFAPGETQKTISIPVKGDVLDEADESFGVRFSGHSNAELGDKQATVTIVDDDETTGGTDDGGPDLQAPGPGGDLPGGKPLRAGRCRGLKATITGTARSDRRKLLVGTSRRDVIAALGGNDRAEGRGGADSICGGRGADTLRGGRGNDRVRGGVGRDRIFGGKGKDTLIAGPGKDTLIGGPGKDRIYTVGETRDRIRCGGGFDVVYAGLRDKVHKSCERVRRIKRR